MPEEITLLVSHIGDYNSLSACKVHILQNQC